MMMSFRCDVENMDEIRIKSKELVRFMRFVGMCRTQKHTHSHSSKRIQSHEINLSIQCTYMHN